MKLTTNEYWANSYSNFKFNKLANDHGVYKYIEKYIPRSIDKSFIEIGSFPGTFTAKFGELGYVLNGIDLYQENATSLKDWLRDQNYNINEFYVSDFLSHKFESKYDVVGSFGFIEHFTNFEDIIINHLEIVKEEGLIIITTPNFRGFLQRIIHKYFANDDYRNHYIPSMNVKVWRETVKSYGFEIIHSGYFGGFKLWVPLERKSFFNRQFYRIVHKLSILVDKIVWFDSSVFSQYCGIVAKKI